ncbi:MAG: ferrous iron transport protein B [Longimicrobiales bacterium]|nr:ferrous iron transport protein B [Longimicrobiales bacterium]
MTVLTKKAGGRHGEVPSSARVGPGYGSPGRPEPPADADLKVALVGAPNVGKSTLFNKLTGAYVTVSNYPGTSVGVDRGHGELGDRAVEFIDTPGMYSLLPTTEEERVARRIVLEGAADVVVQVADAKSLERALPLTLQLLEVGRPLVLAVNMMDEAEALGLEIDVALLEERLGIAVVPVVAVKGQGLDALAVAVEREVASPPPVRPVYSNGVGEAIDRVRGRLQGAYPVDPTVFASLLIQGDAEAAEWVATAEPDEGDAAVSEVESATSEFADTAIYRVAYERHRASEKALEGAVRGGDEEAESRSFRTWLGSALARPLIGIPFLLVVLYLGLFKFVGEFGSGTVVDWLETTVFENGLNPIFQSAFETIIPWPWLQGLFVGEYGLLTLGVRYAVAIILPIVGTFFLFFSILEDSGYFPRLALLVDRLFKKIGLSGRAVIPMVLGFACDTMATMVTRTLETNRERVLATLLLALAIPCSAQLGVILAILSGSGAALAVLVGVIAGVFLLVGWIGSKVLPGDAPTFHMELPPMRMPTFGNVMTKTTSRMQWYFMEVLPLFLLASVLLWAGDLTGILEVVLAGMTPIVGVLGLPAETAEAFLFGFFRRDYGAAGLFDLNQEGLLSVRQLTVAAVTLTLFVPCVAQFLMMLKERGVKTAMAIFLFTVPFAFGVGALLNQVLRGFGW